MRASVPAVSRYQPTPQAQRRASGISSIPVRTQGVMGKHPHSTKIELRLLLIPDEQVLLFKGPNPLQSTPWNPNPLPLSPTLHCTFFPVFLPAFRLSWISRRNKRTESCMSCRNVQEEKHLRKQSFALPPATERCVQKQGQTGI